MNSNHAESNIPTNDSPIGNLSAIDVICQIDEHEIQILKVLLKYAVGKPFVDVLHSIRNDVRYSLSLDGTGTTAKEKNWLIGMTGNFIKDISPLDKKMQGRILDAITDIISKPLAARGDTIKALSGDLKGFWRYRLGDYRLVFRPIAEEKQVQLIAFSSRGGVYE